MVLMLRHVLKAGPADHRFAAKGIGSRALLVVPAASVAMPLVWTHSRRLPYPFWMDDLFLSIVALDLAGNLFDLSDGYEHFDLIPDAHGIGALTVLAAWLLRSAMRRAAVVATAGHALLEGGESSIGPDRLVHVPVGCATTGSTVVWSTSADARCMHHRSTPRARSIGRRPRPTPTRPTSSSAAPDLGRPTRMTRCGPARG